MQVNIHASLLCLVFVSEVHSMKIKARNVELKQVNRKMTAETDATLPWLYANILGLQTGGRFSKG